MTIDTLINESNIYNQADLESLKKKYLGNIYILVEKFDIVVIDVIEYEIIGCVIEFIYVDTQESDWLSVYNFNRMVKPHIS